MDETHLTTSHDASLNLLTASNIAILKGDLFGRSFLGHRGLRTMEPGPVDVFLVQSILTSIPDRIDSNSLVTPRPILGYIRGLLSRVFEASWATHWAIEIDGDYYELDRIKSYRWPFWKAKIAVHDVAADAQGGLRQRVGRTRIGMTWMDEAEIAARGISSLIFSLLCQFLVKEYKPP